MRAIVSDYQVIIPDTLESALQILYDNDDILILAGGTDVMVLFEKGLLTQKTLLDISRFSELKNIISTKTHIHIGALATFSQIAQNKEFMTHFPNLAQAAKQIGAVAIQNRATIGGNIANASPAGDSLPALLSYSTQIELESKNGKRLIPYEQYHIDYKKTVRKNNELITNIIIEKKHYQYHYFRKVGTRSAQAISKVVFSGILSTDSDNNIEDVRIALGSVAPIPLRCLQTESLLFKKRIDDTLIQKAGDMLMSEIHPIDDIRSTEQYRRIVAKNLLVQFLKKQ